MTNNLSSILQTINHNVDHALVNLAKYPDLRESFEVPSLVHEKDDNFSFSFHKFATPVSAIREMVTYTYLLNAMNNGVLEVNKETLLEAAKAMRKSPIVEYSFLSMYHKQAARVYQKEGNEKKQRIHTLAYRIAEVKDDMLDLHYTDYLSPDDEERMEAPRFRDLLNLLNTNELRFQALLLYIVRYVTTVLKVNPIMFLRPQYLLVEEALGLALGKFASDERYDVELRSCFYYYRSLYYGLTCREGLAEHYKERYLTLGGERNYEELCNSLLDRLPALHRSETDLVDYVMKFNMECEESLDMELCDTYDLDYELPLTGFYREKLLDSEFNSLYVLAEKGDVDAIHQVARCYREGDGVAVCKAAADAWENKLIKV